MASRNGQGPGKSIVGMRRYRRRYMKNGTSVETRLFNGSHDFGGDLSRLSLR